VVDTVSLERTNSRFLTGHCPIRNDKTYFLLQAGTAEGGCFLPEHV
jgi:hypothetical protein